MAVIVYYTVYRIFRIKYPLIHNRHILYIIQHIFPAEIPDSIKYDPYNIPQGIKKKTATFATVIFFLCNLYSFLCLHFCASICIADFLKCHSFSLVKFPCFIWCIMPFFPIPAPCESCIFNGVFPLECIAI